MAAHRGALAAGSSDRCATVGVLGCGIDQIYPQSSREVARKVAKQGCVMSEYPPGVPPHKYHFPVRNRIVAGLCCAVVVVEAPRRSGALIAANVAAAEGRDVMVRAAGVRALHADGAHGIERLVDLTATGSTPLQEHLRRVPVTMRASPPHAPGSWRTADHWLVGSLRWERAHYSRTSQSSSPQLSAESSGA